MTDDPPDVVAFIAARLDDEEATAHMAPKGPWTWTAADTSSYPQRITNAGAVLIAQCYDNPDLPASCAEHIAMQDPAATLARVQALRGILADYEKTARQQEENAARFSRAMREDPPNQEKITQLKTRGWELAGRMQAMRAAVFRVASAYRLRPDGSVHPDWRDEWA